MAKDNKYKVAQVPFKIFLDETLKRQRSTIMDKIVEILQQLCKGDHSGSITPFKVEGKFEISIFEFYIDVDTIDKWLNLLDGYFSVHDFPR